MFDYKKLQDLEVDFSVINYIYHPNEIDRQNAFTAVFLHGFPSNNIYLIIAKGDNKIIYEDKSGNEFTNIEFDEKSSTLYLSDAWEEFYIKIAAKKFELYNLGNIEIKNPYQLLIDLELVNP